MPYGRLDLSSWVSDCDAVLVPDAHVEVAGASRPGVVRLGHERDAPAVEVGDLLRPVLEEHAPVGRFEDLVVADVHLVLARCGLALAELDRDPGLGHLVAEQTVERLRLGRLEEVVVLVVVAEALRDVPAVAGGLLPRLLEDVVLELRARLDGQAHRGGLRDLLLEDRPRRDRDLHLAFVVVGVTQHEGRLLEPGQDPERVPDRLRDPVAVAGLPVHQREALGRVHLHVRAEEVRAEVGAVVDDAVEERLGLDALAHEAALHVGDGDDQRVDPAVRDHGLQLGHAGVDAAMGAVAFVMGGVGVGRHQFPSDQCVGGRRGQPPGCELAVCV